ncbi:BON domain-containing protein [Methylophilus sp. 5]|uniref:BON domain-containing protein n=1 Tax=Methylophilus sp. 5 TaxID=1112274 RepID=UPI000492156F|nr:BON domain-containing protein [Methylophilus sp. 5]
MNNQWLVAGFGVMLSAQAFAVTIDEMHGEQAPYAQAFKAVDADGNGKLSKKEAAKDKDFPTGAFAKADKNHNGSLDQDEFAAYKSKVDNAENKQTATDSAITAKIKSKYLVEKDFSSFKVSVETKDNAVILSGFVDSAEQKARAEKIATSVDGVKTVKNALVVKP